MSETFLIPASIIIHTYTPVFAYVFLCLMIALALTYFKKKYEAVVFSAGFMATSGSVFVLKHTFAILRPSDALLEADGFAFPSSHAAVSMFLATTLSWLLLRNLRPTQKIPLLLITTLFSLAVLIGLSRIVIHVHTPFQVLIGFLIGVLIPYLIIKFAPSLGKVKSAANQGEA